MMILMIESKADGNENIISLGLKEENEFELQILWPSLTFWPNVGIAFCQIENDKKTIPLELKTLRCQVPRNTDVHQPLFLRSLA